MLGKMVQYICRYLNNNLFFLYHDKMTNNLPKRNTLIKGSPDLELTSNQITLVSYPLQYILDYLI
jgi:hypothetical protein